MAVIPGWYLYQAEERVTGDGSGATVDEELNEHLEMMLIVGVVVGIVGLLVSLTWLWSRPSRRGQVSGRGRRSP